MIAAENPAERRPEQKKEESYAKTDGHEFVAVAVNRSERIRDRAEKAAVLGHGAMVSSAKKSVDRV